MKFFNIYKSSFILCFLLAICIIAFYKKETNLYKLIESSSIDLFSPIVEKANDSAHFIDNALSDIKNIFIVFSENKDLREKNKLLNNYFYLYQQTKAENMRLKEQLNFTTKLPDKYLTAKIIGNNNNSLLQQIIINSGSNSGIREGQLVISNNQLIGRITQVSEHNAKILLIKDIKSRIPAISTESRTKFIAAGNINNNLTCKYLDEHSLLQEGELIVTSGEDVNITSDIIIGYIFKQDNIFYIKPTINFNEIEFVQILQTNHYE